MCDDIHRYLLLNVIGLQGYRSISTDNLIYLQGFRSIPTACKFIPYCLKQHTHTVYPRLLFEWIPWMMAICTLTYFLPCVSKQQIYLVEVLIGRFVRVSIDSCCCCRTTETSLTTFFSRVWIIPIPLDLLGKEIGIHRQFYPPITGYSIDIQYTNLSTDQRAYSIDYCTRLYTYWSKQ